MSKTIFITGSTDGIGKLAAIKLAKDGNKIYLHGRNHKKLLKVIEEVKTASNNQNIEGYIADFSDLKAVRTIAKKLNKELPKIDILINNAGIFKTKTEKTTEGLDIRIVVNYLAPYLFTNEVIPLLKKSSKGCIINLSSAAQSKISMDFLYGKTTVSDNEAYAQSKLAILIWSFYLATKEPTLSVIALNPGSLLNTNMVKEAYGRFWSSADKGADIIYDLAQVDFYHNSSGKYFDNDKGDFGNAHPDAYNTDIMNNLIEKTNTLLKELQP